MTDVGGAEASHLSFKGSFVSKKPCRIQEKTLLVRVRKNMSHVDEARGP